MKWENLFSRKILDRGKEYYRRRHVSIFNNDEDHCEAEVRGTGRYFVEIDKLPEGGYEVYCTCPYARDGNMCKHMAAVFYAWQGETKEEPVSVEIPDRIVFPFEKIDYRDHHYPMDAIMRQYLIRESVYQRAQKIEETGTWTVNELHTQFEDDGTDDQQIYAAASPGGEPPLNMVQLTVNKQKITSGYCFKCRRQIYGRVQFDRDRLCEHEVFLLMHIGEYILKEDPGDRTNRQGMKLLEGFSRLQADIRLEDTAEPRHTVHLEPRIINDYGLQLSFRIGSGKMYVLKDIGELVRAAENRGSVHLGKGNDIHFAYETFDASSQKYWTYITERYHETASFNRSLRRSENRYMGEVSLKNSIELYGTALDSFYDIAEHTNIPFEDKHARRAPAFLHIGDGEFRMPMEIRAESDVNGYTLVLSGTRPAVIEGAAYRYFVSDGKLSRLDAKDFRTVEPFMNLSYEDDFRVTIGRNALPEFCHRILPVLQENPLIELEENIPDEVREALPAPAEFSFWLDIENGEVICDARVSYSGQEYPLAVYPMTAPDVIRDRTLEQKALDTVENYFPETVGTVHKQIADDDLVYEILGQGVNDLMRYGDVHGSDAFNRLRIRKTPMVRFGVSLESSLLSLEVMSDELSSQELLEILESYRRKKKYHRLSSGEFVDLEENESLDVLTSMLEGMNVSVKEFTAGKLHLPAYRTLYVNKMLEEHENIQAERDSTFRTLVNNFSTRSHEEYPVPESMKSVLRGYQVYGYQWLRTLSDCGFGGILADDMGLGKTIEIIACLQGVIEDGKLNAPALIVCPASVVYNWQEEFRRFAPQVSVIPVTGTLNERKQKLKERPQVFITSYDLLKRDIGIYSEMWFSYVILDEAQFVKNAKAAVSKAVRILHGEHRFALTGTPIENRLSELWSIFDFLMPGFLYHYDLFRTMYETPITRSKDEDAAEKLKKMVSPFILRRLKEEVLTDLPEKLEEVRYARFEEEQRRLYDGQVVHMKEMLARMDENTGESKIRVLAELTRIRQICCDPSLIAEGYTGSSAKREACLDLIESAMDGGHKMLVFSQFTSMLEILEKELAERDIPYYKLTGATSKEDRMKYVQAFNRDDVPVFLISLKAGGTGLNLTGADVVIHYDPWWNLAAQNQATDRAHRIGQQKKVNVFKLIVKDSLEEKILELQESKKDLADAILSGENTSITSLSKEELLELLG